MRYSRRGSSVGSLFLLCVGLYASRRSGCFSASIMQDREAIWLALSAAESGGRAVAMEVLKNTHSVANLIRTSAVHQIQTFIETGAREGMISLEAHLSALVKNGTVSLFDAMEAANEPDSLQMLLKD